ncbi:MAG TPA: HWE histidine kinase domain-containing protein, partial [Steroidobacteraceae bacterium]
YARGFGKRAADLVNLNFWTIIAPEDRKYVEELLGRLNPSNPEIRIENRVLTTEGVRWFLWTNRALEFDEQGRCVEAQSTGVDITDRKAAESQRQLLIDELNHRVKNTLAVVQGIAQQTFTPDASPIEARNAFYGRLAALGAAHGLLSQQNWERVDLDHLVRNTIEASGAAKDRVTVNGTSVLLEPRHALAIALSLHELTTNALKHGALSTNGGKLDLSWSVSHDPEPILHFEWRERDGPPVKAPTRRGFGLLMIERALASELGCRARVDFAPSGVQCSIELLLHQPRPTGSGS